MTQSRGLGAREAQDPQRAQGWPRLCPRSPAARPGPASLLRTAFPPRRPPLRRGLALRRQLLGGGDWTRGGAARAKRKPARRPGTEARDAVQPASEPLRAKRDGDPFPSPAAAPAAAPGPRVATAHCRPPLACPPARPPGTRPAPPLAAAHRAEADPAGWLRRHLERATKPGPASAATRLGCATFHPLPGRVPNKPRPHFRLQAKPN